MSATRLFGTVVFFLATLPVPAAAPPRTALPSQIAQWIIDLGDDSFEVRQEASRKLRAAGAVAEDALEKAATSADAEVKKRALAILTDFRWGIYPDTPETVIELIRNYQAAARSEKRPIIQKLLAAGLPGSRALLKITRAEEDPLVRKEVFTDIAAGLPRLVPVLLDEGNRAAVEALLELSLAGDVNSGAGHYAAYHLLTGTLPARIAAWEQRARKAVVPKAEKEVLAYLYRAAGDVRNALRAAREAERSDLVEGILYESADWKALLELPELSMSSNAVAARSYRAAFARLAGDHKRFATLIKEQIDSATPIARAQANVLPHIKGLFLNGRPVEALQLIQTSGRDPRLRYEIHAARLDMKAAFAVVEEARKGKTADLPVLEILQARTLYLLGEKDRAKATFTTHAEKIHKGTSASWYDDLVDALLATDQPDQAFEVVARILSRSDDAGWPRRLFEKCFGADTADDAAALWTLLAWTGTGTIEKRLELLRRLLEGKASAAEVAGLVEKARGEPPNAQAAILADQRRALGEAALRCKHVELAEKSFRLAGSLPALVRLGDLLAEKKQWALAAAQYHEAYRRALKTRSDAAGALPSREPAGEEMPALALYLHGWALTQAGKAREGKQRIDQAHLLSLGDGAMRYELARALQRRKRTEGARRENELLRLVGEPSLGEPGAYYTGEGLRAAAIEAGQRQQHLKAADGFEQAFLRVLGPNILFARYAAYVTVPGHLARMRARGLAEAGKLADALVEAQRVQACLPGNLEVVIQLLPALEKAGRAREGEALFRRTLGLYETLLNDYPRAAWAHNQAAWLCGCCRRDLDRGEKHARAAVKLAPGTASYHDTLAEVLFQKGKKDEAIAIEKKALALTPGRIYFQKQLERFKKGDPKAPRPSEEE